MNYKLNGISISSYGAKSALSGQAFSLHGMFDLPKRLAPTEYNWGTSIEPYVSAEDIRLDGRTLTLIVVVKPVDLDAFAQACVQCTELSTTYEIYDVVCREEINVQHLGKYCLVVARFWQNNYLLEPTPSNPSASGSFRLDNFDLRKDFGVYVGKSHNLSNTARRIEIPTTEFYERTSYRELRDIILNCSMIMSSTSSLFDSMKKLHSLLMAPGLRSLATPNKTFSVYFKNGLSAIAVKENILQFNLIVSTA